MRDEELGEYYPDKIDNTENDHPPHANLKHHQSPAILRIEAAEAEEYGEAERGKYVIHEKMITQGGYPEAKKEIEIFNVLSHFLDSNKVLYLVFYGFHADLIFIEAPIYPKAKKNSYRNSPNQYNIG